MSGFSIVGSDLLAQATQAQRAGQTAKARDLLERLVAGQPTNVQALTALGQLLLDAGDHQAAIEAFERAAAGGNAPMAWLNLAKARGAAGNDEAALEAVWRALVCDAYFLPALLEQGKILRRLNRSEEAAELLRKLLEAIGDPGRFPEPIRNDLHEARNFLRDHGADRLASFQAKLKEVTESYSAEALKRALGYAEHRAGTRKVYAQQPTGAHFPYLPAIEFFDRELFPWFAELEAHTDEIRAELLDLWAAEDPSFRPYVTFAPGTPVNQWAELNHSPRWSAWFFWENGVAQEENCRRCPKTAGLLERLPLLDLPGKGPTAMFSVLQPRTRIPAHTGTSNIRTTVHLPLIVPDGCGFRVGSETREWRVGEAFAFDDTIEHEAWNDSDHVRAVLILDTWNPLLTEAERAVVRVIG